MVDRELFHEVDFSDWVNPNDGTVHQDITDQLPYRLMTEVLQLAS